MQMVINMRGNGLTIKKMVKVFTLILPLEKNTMVNGMKEKSMVMVYILMLMGIDIQENGKMEKNKVKA